jgi:DNA-binding HxlR family transcriptional regulator
MMTEIQICPKYERAAKLLGKPWTSLILRVLCAGPTSFTRIRRSVNHLSDRVLSERLKDLEKHGIVQRTVYPSVPVKIEYSLTDKGRDLQSVLDALQGWADRWEAAEDCESLVLVD